MAASENTFIGRPGMSKTRCRTSSRPVYLNSLNFSSPPWHPPHRRDFYSICISCVQFKGAFAATEWRLFTLQRVMTKALIHCSGAGLTEFCGAKKPSARLAFYRLLNIWYTTTKFTAVPQR